MNRLVKETVGILLSKDVKSQKCVYLCPLYPMPILDCRCGFNLEDHWADWKWPTVVFFIVMGEVVEQYVPVATCFLSMFLGGDFQTFDTGK